MASDSSRRTRKQARFCGAACLFLGAILSAAGMVCAQTQQPDANEAPLTPIATVTVHGLVKNVVTGEPLPRVLVTVDARSDTGSITDGDGRFVIPDVPISNTVIHLIKPGFEDALQANGGSPGIFAGNRDMPRPISVVEQMPELEFAMRPLNAIRGRIELSSGDSAGKIEIELVRQTVQDGRMMWQQAGATQTNEDGVYRFGGLPDGVYTVETHPSIDGGDDGVRLVGGVAVPMVLGGFGRSLQGGGNTPLAQNGFARAFYSDAHDLGGAARIRLAGGQTAQANLMLRQEAFHLVRATLSGAGLDLAGGGTKLDSGAIIAQTGTDITLALSGFQPEVLDTSGHFTGYQARYESQTHTIQAMLPDGDYRLRVTGFRPSAAVFTGNGGGDARTIKIENFLSGQSDISVNGHAITNLHIALAPESPTPLMVTVNRTENQSTPPSSNNGNEGAGVFISATQAGNSADPMNSQFAQGSVPGTLETSSLAPGAYWLHTVVTQPGLCESSFTAGGANLAHEPLVVGQGGSTAPLTLILRDDCASLRLSIPPSPSAASAVEAPMYYVYVIPDFDSTTEVRTQMLRPSMVNSTTLENLTPGAYHVYMLDRETDLPFRDPDAMAALNLQGQAITLSPGTTASLVLEAPAK